MNDAIPHGAPLPDVSVPPPVSGRPWGFWATLAFTLLLLCLHMAISLAAIIGYMVVKGFDPNRNQIDDFFLEISTNGNVISAVSLVSALIIPAGCILFAGLRRGITIKEYLGLKSVPAVSFFGWLIAAVVGAGALEVLMPTGELPEFMVRVYESVSFEALLWMAVAVGAPIWEEFLFRGFLFSGLRASALGTVGTIIFTSLAFGCLHLGQYDTAGVLSTVAVGALLGIARAVSDSLYVSIAMHSAYNLVAMIQLTYAMQEAQPAFAGIVF